MDINIAILAGLQLVPGHKKFPVQFLVQLIEDQAPLCGHQGTVCVGIALIADIADGLALCIYIIHHMDEILLVVPVIPVALGHCRVHLI